MTREDLIALTPDVLAALSNRGLVKRATREVDAGERPVLTEDADEARKLGRWLITAYLNVPVYQKFHEWLGRGEAMRPMNEAWAAGDRQGALKAIPDEVVDDLIVHGSAAECRERVREYVSNGLTTPILMLLPNSQLNGVEAVRALAPTA